MDEMGSELLAAQRRVQSAQNGAAKAQRRLTLAEEAVVAARRELETAAAEEKAATTALETLIPRMMRAAMKKGGRASIAIAEVMIRQLSGDQPDASEGGAAGAPAN